MLDDARGLITMERTKQGLECILKPPFTIPTLINEDPGYCKGELACLERQSEKETGQRKPVNADAANAIMEDWLKTVQLQFGQQEPSSGPQYLRDELNFTTSELYEFFAYILPDCIRAEEQYQICRDRTRKYEPVLASSQEGARKEPGRSRLRPFGQRISTPRDEAIFATGFGEIQRDVFPRCLSCRT